MESRLSERTRALVESALLVAVATVLSLIKMAELPYGGSITLASMFPIILVSYRHGMLWGLGAGTVFGALQQVLGLDNLSYVTGWQSVLAVIFLDYIIAFAVAGLGGAFRRLEKRGMAQSVVLTLGALLVGILRYACHVVSGATVWAGLSIPDAAALMYSFIYNATYMIPETIVLMIVSFALGNMLDFSRVVPVRFSEQKKVHKASPYLFVSAIVIAAAALIYDVVTLFSHMQSPDTGEFDVTMLSEVSWTAFIVVSVVGAVLVTALFVTRYVLNKDLKKESQA